MNYLKRYYILMLALLFVLAIVVSGCSSDAELEMSNLNSTKSKPSSKPP